MIAILFFAIFFSFRPKLSHRVELAVGQKLHDQANSVAALFSLKLEKTRQDTKILADLATDIFSHPESYRLSAQPGEYDYDEKIGIYGSVRNDGTSVAFLSTLTPLTPNLLKEVRLSEYLNPMFQTLLRQNPDYGRLSLITVDSFQRSFPWFNFKEQIRSGRMKKDYQSSNRSIFAKANPANDPLRDVVWEVIAADFPERGNRVLCAAPFFAGDPFHGIIVTEVNPVSLAKECFLASDFRDRQALILGNGDRVLGISPLIEQSVIQASSDGTPEFLKDLKLRNFSKLKSILSGLPMKEGYSGRLAEDYLQVLPLGPIPARLVALVTPGEVIDISAGESPGLFWSRQRWATWIAVIAGLMLSLNSLWIFNHRKKPEKTSGDEGDAPWPPPESMERFDEFNSEGRGKPGEDASPFDEEEQSLVIGEDHPTELLDECIPDSAERPDDDPFPFREAEQAFDANAMHSAEMIALQSLTHQVAILSCLDMVGPMSLHLPRLCETLQEVFSVQHAIILLYSQEDRTFRALWENPVIREEGAGIRPLEIKAEGFLDLPADSRNVFYINTPSRDSGGDGGLSLIVKRNYMVGALLFQEKILGGVLLVDKDSDFTIDDKNHLLELGGSIALTLRNLYQCEGLLKIDELRREYGLALRRAVETTLDRIREEVQVIYIRFGRSSPSQKKHCEAILFEVGKLMEVVKEVREFDPESDLLQTSSLTETLDSPTMKTEHTP